MFRFSLFYRIALVALTFSVGMQSCPATRPTEGFLIEEVNLDSKGKSTQPLPSNPKIGFAIKEIVNKDQSASHPIQSTDLNVGGKVEPAYAPLHPYVPVYNPLITQVQTFEIPSLHKPSVPMNDNVASHEIAELRKKWLAIPQGQGNVQSKIEIVLKLLTEGKYNLFFGDQKGPFSKLAGTHFFCYHEVKIDNAFKAIPNPSPQQKKAHEEFQNCHINVNNLDLEKSASSASSHTSMKPKSPDNTQNSTTTTTTTETTMPTARSSNTRTDPLLQTPSWQPDWPGWKKTLMQTSSVRNTSNNSQQSYAPLPPYIPAYNALTAEVPSLHKATAPVNNTVEDKDIAELKQKWHTGTLPLPGLMDRKIEIVLKLLTEEKFHLFFGDNAGPFNKRAGSKFADRYADKIDNAFKAIAEPSPQQKKAHKEFQSHHPKLLKDAPEKSSNTSIKRKGPDNESSSEEGHQSKRLKSSATTTTTTTTTTVTTTQYHQQ